MADDSNSSSASTRDAVSTITTSSTNTTPPSASMASNGYVNRGLELWEKRRREWQNQGKAAAGGGRASAAATAYQAKRRARSVDVDTIIESIFSTTGDARLPQPVPLSQMIDLLVDFWEADGLYD